MDHTRRTSRGARSPWDYPVAALWGFSEATFFIFVPDVWLTKIAMRDPKRALRSLAPALAGAVAGGAVTYRWARARDEGQTREALVRLPAVNHEMIDKVEAVMRQSLPKAMILGPAKGRPFKLYARTAGHNQVGLVRFMAFSVPARLPRFTIVTAGSIGLRHLLLAKAPGMARYANAIHAGAWTAFYCVYFSRVGRTGTGRDGSRRLRDQ